MHDHDISDDLFDPADTDYHGHDIIGSKNSGNDKLRCFFIAIQDCPEISAAFVSLTWVKPMGIALSLMQQRFCQ